MIEKIYQPSLSRNKIAKFAKVVSECANNGDNVALSILNDAAFELAELSVVILKKAGMPDSLAIYGGVLQHNSYILSKLKEILKKDFPDIELTYPKALPEFGAVAAAMNSDGILNEKIIEKLCNYK